MIFLWRFEQKTTPIKFVSKNFKSNVHMFRFSSAFSFNYFTWSWFVFFSIFFFMCFCLYASDKWVIWMTPFLKVRSKSFFLTMYVKLLRNMKCTPWKCDKLFTDSLQCLVNSHLDLRVQRCWLQSKTEQRDHLIKKMIHIIKRSQWKKKENQKKKITNK